MVSIILIARCFANPSPSNVFPYPCCLRQCSDRGDLPELGCISRGIRGLNDSDPEPDEFSVRSVSSATLLGGFYGSLRNLGCIPRGLRELCDLPELG